MKRFFAVAGLLIFGTSTWGEIYKCGNTFTNSAAEAKAKLCRLIEEARPAAEWREVSQSADGTVFVNDKTIRPQGRFRKAWALWMYHEEQQDADGKPYRSSKTLYYFDCGAMTLAVKQTLYYPDRIGDAASNYAIVRDEDQLRMRDVVPGSVAETLTEHACRVIGK